MRKKNTIPGCLLLLLFILSGLIPAQAQYDNVFFRLKPASQKGSLLYNAGAYEKAIPYIRQALQEQSNQQLNLMLAHAYALTGKSNESVRLYKQQGDPYTLEAKHLLAYTLCLQSLGRTEEARASFQAYMAAVGEKGEVAEDLGRTDYYRTAIRYSVHPLSINSRQNEFAPLLTQQGMLFVSDRKKGSIVKKNFSGHETDLDIYKTDGRSNTRFVNTTRLSNAVNSSLHEGPVAQDTSGTLYFSRSDRYGKLSLWKAHALPGKKDWKDAEKIKIPAAGNLFHPAVNADGSMLYFVSDMPGGMGGSDIYYSYYQDGAWSEPINAGPKINSPGNESFPVLQHNKLYFSSDGRIGLGRLDIYEAFVSGATIIYVRNMGAPINSAEDDFGLVWMPDGSGGYFSSNRKGSRGGDDLYRVDYHMITLEGTLRDSTNYKPLAGARVELQNPDGSTRHVITNDAGAYTFTLFPGEVYKITMEAKNYRSRSFNYSTLQGKQWGKRPFEAAMERKTKVFVLGNVRLPDKKRAAHAELVVWDISGGRPELIETNDRGGFEVELDTESNYSFLFSCNTLGALATFKTSGRSDASLSHYLNVDLDPFIPYVVKGTIEGADLSKPLLVWLTNSLSSESTMLWTDGNTFSFDAISLVEYELCVQQGDKKAVLSLGKNWQKDVREITLKLQ